MNVKPNYHTGCVLCGQAYTKPRLNDVCFLCDRAVKNVAKVEPTRKCRDCGVPTVNYHRCTRCHSLALENIPGADGHGLGDGALFL